MITKSKINLKKYEEHKKDIELADKMIDQDRRYELDILIGNMTKLSSMMVYI